MNIRITEDGDGRWDLWVTRQDALADEKPIYAAWGRSPEQIEALLRGILADTPRKAAKALRDSELAAVQGATLYAMLTILDGWIEDARSNHHAMEHRGENRGEECWRKFAPADVRSMVNDVARKLGIPSFPEPRVGKEDEPT